jgi:siroheme decarboxylase
MNSAADTPLVPIDDTDRKIINTFQGGFPICARPYAEAARSIALEEGDFLERLERLKEAGALSRFGPLYNAERSGGAVTLAAMEVPPERFEDVSTLVNAHDEVAHNYERTHKLNMWFVLAVEDPSEIDAVNALIEQETGLKVLNMPKLEEFFLELKLEV